MINITRVYASDWEGLYVNDDLVTEGHQINLDNVVEYFKMGFESYETYEITGEWIDLEGSLPESLDELKSKDEFEENQIDELVYGGE